MKIVTVLGSVTPPGRMHRAISGALDRANARDIDTELLDLATLKLPFAGMAVEGGFDTDRVIEALTTADGVILSSPVYRASMTGSLKNLLDLLPLEVLRGKPCGIVAMGASSHHYLGVDAHLRDVLAWFGALMAPSSVYLVNSDFSEAGLSEGASANLDALVDALAKLATLGGAPFGPIPLAAGKG
jgi:FMN reductase